MQYGSLNIFAGWITMVLGIVSGSIIGLWSFNGPFPTPRGHTSYGDLPRRMVRLAHIALFALPIINILYGQFIDTIPLENTYKWVGSYSMIVCMIGVPLFLILGAVYLPFKYLEVIPVSAGTVALAIISYGHYLLLLNYL